MTQKSPQTIFWHDYETWGATPQKDHASQFAGVRTDLELNIIDEPVMFYNQIASDCLPQPQACLITGITPQVTQHKGLVERDFIAEIHQQFSQANTCVVGYNNIRFDDEVTRYTLYRNFYDPYAREWKNGNSRWDIIDVVRACYALRPEGIEWPLKETGQPSFKLEDLSKANHIEHENAHDAMSDVYATIAIAKLIKEAQPKLYDYLFNLRLKKNVLELIDCVQFTPLVHVSSKLPSEHGCCTWIVPIGFHPVNKNALIVLNLALDPSPLFDLSAEQIKQKLYTPNDMLEEGEQRLPIKLVHINKCPVLAPAKTLTAENAQRLNIDRDTCLQHLHLIKNQPSLLTKLQEIYTDNEPRDELDADHALYTGGFFSSADKYLMEQVIEADLEKLTELTLPFEDPRLHTLLFRYRARNFPQSLSQQEAEKWQRYRHFKITDESSNGSIKLTEYLYQIEQLSEQYKDDPNKLSILKSLLSYAKNL